MFEFLPWEDRFYFKADIYSPAPEETMWTVDADLLCLLDCREVWWIADCYVPCPEDCGLLHYYDCSQNRLVFDKQVLLAGYPIWWVSDVVGDSACV